MLNSEELRPYVFEYLDNNKDKKNMQFTDVARECFSGSYVQEFSVYKEYLLFCGRSLWLSNDA